MSWSPPTSTCRGLLGGASLFADRNFNRRPRSMGRVRVVHGRRGLVLGIQPPRPARQRHEHRLQRAGGGQPVLSRRVGPWVAPSGKCRSGPHPHEYNRQTAVAVSVHINAGDPVAQVEVLARSHRRAVLKVLAAHARLARDLQAVLVEWYQRRGRDRSAYKKLAPSQQQTVTF